MKVPAGAVVLGYVEIVRYIDPDSNQSMVIVNRSSGTSSFDAHGLIAMGLTSLAGEALGFGPDDNEEEDE